MEPNPGTSRNISETETAILEMDLKELIEKINLVTLQVLNTSKGTVQQRRLEILVEQLTRQALIIQHEIDRRTHGLHPPADHQVPGL
jgi:hypothetical protein